MYVTLPLQDRPPDELVFVAGLPRSFIPSGDRPDQVHFDQLLHRTYGLTFPDPDGLRDVAVGGPAAGILASAPNKVAIANLRGHREHGGRRNSLWNECTNAAEDVPGNERFVWGRQFLRWALRITRHRFSETPLGAIPEGDRSRGARGTNERDRGFRHVIGTVRRARRPLVWI
jgi:hypothetical protein